LASILPILAYIYSPFWVHEQVDTIKSMEILQISVQARDFKGNELWRTCRTISEAALQETGCAGSNISQDTDNKNLIYLEESWESRPHLEAYFRSDVFSALLGALKLLGETFEIKINDGSEDEGMEAVQGAREKRTFCKQ
jgi:quinol monooxygenase YgiN